MMRRRGSVLVVLSLVLGGIAAWGANTWVEGRLSGESSTVGKSLVVAAAIEIPYGTKIEGRHVRTLEVPDEAVPNGSIAMIDDVLGMVASVAIERGEILSRNRLAEHKLGSTLAALIDKNMRAITVRVDDVVGVAGFLLPGNRVDILSSRMDMRTKRATTQTILRNLKVLAVDQTASTDQDTPVIVRAVTLEMAPSQSEILVKAKEEGTIQLTLRNPLEEELAAAPKPVAQKVAAPAPVKKKRTYKPRSSTIQVIRGTSVHNEKARI